MKQFDVRMQDKDVRVTLTPDAAQQLVREREPIVIDAALYFSCLIKKICQVASRKPDPGACRISNGLYLSFRTVMTKRCSLDDYDPGDGVTEFSAKRPQTWVPKWVRLDFRQGQWQAEFGY